MNKKEIQNIITMTIKELRCQGMLKDEYSIILKDIEPILREHFQKQENTEISCLLKKYFNDPYINVIYMQYRDGLNIERIAEYMNKDVSTIRRNKKRLIKKIYNELDII